MGRSYELCSATVAFFFTDMVKFEKIKDNNQGRSEGGSWGARDPPLGDFFVLNEQHTIFRGQKGVKFEEFSIL